MDRKLEMYKQTVETLSSEQRRKEIVIVLHFLLMILANKGAGKVEPLTARIDINPEQIDADNQDDIDRAATVLLADVDM